MIAHLTPTEQAPDATPPRRTTAIVATEGSDWRWTFTPPVPADVAPRLAELAAEMASEAGLRDELEGWPMHARDTEWDIRAEHHERRIALAFDAALDLGYVLTVRPALGRPREREMEGMAAQ